MGNSQQDGGEISEQAPLTAVHPMEAELTHRRSHALKVGEGDGIAQEEPMQDAQEQPRSETASSEAEEGSTAGDIAVVVVVVVIMVALGAFFYSIYTHLSAQANEMMMQHNLENKPDPKHMQFPIDLAQLYQGHHAHLDVDRKHFCRHCAGTGMDVSSGYRTCSTCQGTGVQTTLQQIGPFQQHVRSVCKTCQGRGRVANKHCSSCHGHGVVHEHAQVELTVEPGMRHGDTILLEDAGDHLPRLPPSDLIVHLVAQPHAVFTRRGDDLEVTLNISLVEALTGFSTQLVHLDQHLVPLKRDQIVGPTTVWRIPKQGMPIVGQRGQFGDLLLRFEIAFPESLSIEEREVVANLL